MSSVHPFCRIVWHTIITRNVDEQNDCLCSDVRAFPRHSVPFVNGKLETSKSRVNNCREAGDDCATRQINLRETLSVLSSRVSCIISRTTRIHVSYNNTVCRCEIEKHPLRRVFPSVRDVTPSSRKEKAAAATTIFYRRRLTLNIV